jgi:hypothetical protein
MAVSGDPSYVRRSGQRLGAMRILVSGWKMKGKTRRTRRPPHLVLNKHFVLGDTHAVFGMAPLLAEKNFYSSRDCCHQSVDLAQG